MDFIEASCGTKIYIDSEDKPFLERFAWSINSAGYGASTAFVGNKWKGILIHRFILGLKKEGDIDHINRNPLDNRKCNLRRCSRSQNIVNSKIRGGTYCPYRGVTFEKSKLRTKFWRAKIRFNNKSISLGYYLSAKEAAKAYDKKAMEIYGPLAVLNFSEEVPQ